MNVELPFVKDMFNAIAPRYDLLNRLLSLRQDVYWRRVMMTTLDIPPGGRLLDVACGTGDVAIEAWNRKSSGIRIVGVDFSPEMLRFGLKKTSRIGARDGIQLVAGNALQLPVKPETFDAVTIAFGIRNIADKEKALTSFYRCLKKGGSLAVLELTTPPPGFFRSLYLFYFQRALPLIGKWVSGDAGAYSYLPESVLHFPESRKFAAMMRRAGFSDVRWRGLTLGIATLYIGKKFVGAFSRC